MTDNVHALPGYSVPSREPVAKVVEILEQALKLAKDGIVVGVAVVCAYRDPASFGNNFHGEQSSRHSLAAGVLALGYQIGQELVE